MTDDEEQSRKPKERAQTGRTGNGTGNPDNKIWGIITFAFAYRWHISLFNLRRTINNEYMIYAYADTHRPISNQDPKF